MSDALPSSPRIPASKRLGTEGCTRRRCPLRMLVSLSLILGPLLLAACALGVDAEQARICRLALPALNPDGRVVVTRAVPWPEGRAVRIEYRVEREDRPALLRAVICRFAAEGLARNKAELIGVVTERGPLSGAAVHLLKRFYLETPEGPAGDPGPGDRAAGLIEVPPGLAYGLQQAIAGLPRTAIYSLLASAYALVFGLVGRINLAFGEIAALGASATTLGIAMLLSGNMAAPLPGLALGLAFAVLAGAMHSAIGGYVTILRIRAKSPQPSLIATVGLSLALMEYLRLVQGSGTVWIPPVWSASVPLLRAGDFIVSLTPATLLTTGLASASAGALVLLMGPTRFGRAWRACADDPKAAALFGVDRERLLVVTLALAGAMAGLAGTLVVFQYGGLGFAGGFQFGLKALIAAILGGIGSVGGALLGGLAIGLVETIWSAYLPIEARDIALYGALVVVLVFRPSGLFGLSEPMARQI